MPEREPGFYWVYFPGRAEWTVAEWIGEYWLVTGVDDALDDDEFTEIGERVRRIEG